MQIWKVDPATCARAGSHPRAVFHVDASGNFGPAAINGQKHYEIHVIRPEGGQQHFYYEPFQRSNYLLRLNLSPVEVINANTAPYTASTIAVLAFDVKVDQTTDTSDLVGLGPFLSGVDLYMPATEPPDGTVTFEHQQRPRRIRH